MRIAVAYPNSCSGGAIAADMSTVFPLLAMCQHHPDALGYGKQFECIAGVWQPSATLPQLAEDLTARLGRGFSERNIRQIATFI